MDLSNEERDVFKKESEGGLLRLNWKQVEFLQAGAGAGWRDDAR